MQVYPAIDIKQGRVVRESASADIVYDHDPVAVASRWLAKGASWLHVVDLDRALATGADNDAMLRAICSLPNATVQIGGSLSSVDDVTRALELGGARAIVATAAAAVPEQLERIAAAVAPASLAVSLDVRDGQLTRRGAGAALEVAPADLLGRAAALGICIAVYRDLDRDGALGGPDVVGAERLLGLGADVLVSGGVASADHLRAVRTAGFAGAIVGRALHEGRLTLSEALACSR